MGVASLTPKQAFTIDDVRNRDMIIKMLSCEDDIIHGSAQAMYKTDHYLPRQSLTIEHAIQRIVLDSFGFTTTDQDVSNYRKIFSNYYTSATEYDKEVLNSVTYMRENKLLYYDRPPVQIGQDVSTQLKHCFVSAVDGVLQTTLSEIMGQFSWNCMFVAAFSGS